MWRYDGQGGDGARFGIIIWFVFVGVVMATSGMLSSTTVVIGGRGGVAVWSRAVVGVVGGGTGVSLVSISGHAVVMN